LDVEATYHGFQLINELGNIINIVDVTNVAHISRQMDDD